MISDATREALSKVAVMLVIAAFCVVFLCLGLLDPSVNTDSIKRKALAETTLHLGKPGPGKCSVDIPLSTWEHMNNMGIYRWIVACEDKLNEQ